MEYVIGALLGLVSLAIICHPFLKTRPTTNLRSQRRKMDELINEQRTILEEINRLNLDLDVSNIAKEDYDEQIVIQQREYTEKTRDQELLISKEITDENNFLDCGLEREIKIRKLAIHNEFSSDEYPQSGS